MDRDGRSGRKRVLRVPSHQLTRADFEGAVERALAEVPAEIADQIDNLTVVVEAHPTPDQDPDGEGLLGLYEGVSLADRGIDYYGALPDRISIFMRGHLALGLDRAETLAEVRTTLLHEIGHHLGIDDDRLHELGWA